MNRIEFDQDNVLAPQFENAIKASEGPQDAGWDYKQYSGPYGVRRGPNETLTDEQVLARFHDELAKANTMVKSLGVPMSPGKEAALTSLTYNAGPKWMNSGLGQAVRNGDWETARNIFLQYNKAGGQENAGLRRRRNQEALWFDQDDGQTPPVDPGSPPQKPIDNAPVDALAMNAAPPQPQGPTPQPLPAPDLALAPLPPKAAPAVAQESEPQAPPQNPAAPLINKAAGMMQQAKSLSPIDALPGNIPDSQQRVQQALAMARAATPGRSKVSSSIIPSLSPEDDMPEKPSKKKSFSEHAFMADGGTIRSMYGPNDRQSTNIEDNRANPSYPSFWSGLAAPIQQMSAGVSRGINSLFPSSQDEMQRGLQEAGNLLPHTEGHPYSGPAYTTPQPPPVEEEFVSGGMPLQPLQGRLSDAINASNDNEFDDDDIDDVEHFAQGGPAWFAKSEARGMTHAGPLLSAVPGRTDKLPISVKAGSFVMPADTVSALGQGNTAAGNKVLSGMFRSGPFGMPTLHGKTSFKSAASVSKRTTKSTFKSPKLFADGGAPIGDGNPAVPIIAAGGEYVVPPEQVAQLGNGDLDRGHAILNQWVQDIRKNHIETLASLPPPAK